MTSIIPIPVETTMRRATTGALATDPTIGEGRRRVRRVRRPAAPAGGPPEPVKIVRLPATDG